MVASRIPGLILAAWLGAILPAFGQGSTDTLPFNRIPGGSEPPSQLPQGSTNTVPRNRVPQMGRADDNEGYGIPSDRVSPRCRTQRELGQALPCSFYNGGERRPGPPQAGDVERTSPNSGSSFSATVRLPAREDLKPGRRVERLAHVAPYLVSCWQPSDDERWRARAVTVSLVFNRDGGLIGSPRITAGAARANDDRQRAFADSVLAAIARCVPLPLGAGFEKAIPGRRFLIRFVSDTSKDV